MSFPYRRIRTIVGTIKGYWDMLDFMESNDIEIADLHNENRVIKVISPTEHQFFIADPGVFGQDGAYIFQERILIDAKKALNFSEYFGTPESKGLYEKDTYKTRRRCMETIKKGFDMAWDAMIGQDCTNVNVNIERRGNAKKILDKMVEDVEEIIK